uniref:G-protein coupled receptors family 1 profile domain-containing protein n=1 Tax=Moschus moschiferus TaxID=68415 RepID=A0A8C6CL40_MOSMO
MTSNPSRVTEFCLSGFPGSQGLHHVLFAVFFLFYSVTIMGNTVIIVIICVDKHLQSPMLLIREMQTISLTACVAQLFLYLALGTTEFAMVGVMAVDRSVAVCNPLRYNTMMNSHTCISVVTGSWVFGFLSEIWPVYTTFQFTFCKSNVLDYFYCDRGQLLKLSGDDTLFTEFVLFLMAVFIILSSLAPTIVSYTYIISTILKIPTTSGRRKAFSSCASHFTFVVIGYGSCLFLCVKPKQTQAAEYNKTVSLLIFMLTLLLNPFIFTLRNDKVKQSLRDGVKNCCQLLKD